MPFETEYATQLRDQGYRTGWKDGYDEGYKAAWKEMEEQKVAEEENLSILDKEGVEVDKAEEASKKENPVEISTLREGDWTKIPVSEVVKEAAGKSVSKQAVDQEIKDLRLQHYYETKPSN